jgi:hypothetical protein
MEPAGARPGWAQKMYAGWKNASTGDLAQDEHSRADVDDEDWPWLTIGKLHTTTFFGPRDNPGSWLATAAKGSARTSRPAAATP